jgi:RNA polymerase sigma-70 factor (ECF subfamily)
VKGADRLLPKHVHRIARVRHLGGTHMPTRSVPTPTAELLIAHVGWIRELARHMVADAHVADDIAQEACIAALERPPGSASDGLRFRSWLASVMRNALRQRGRTEMRREAREEIAAREERLDAADRLLERVSVERELVAAVLELDEPYRTAVLLRFFESLPPREIARRLGVPVNTVQSRLSRGLARLRERLDREHGDRAAWMGLLVPAAGKSSGFSGAVVGGWIVNAKVTLSIVGVVVIGTLAALSTLRGGEARPSVSGAELAAGRTKEDAHPLATNEALVVAGPATDREALAVGSAAELSKNAEPGPLPAPAAHVVRGRVLDETAAPVSGVRLQLQSSGASSSPEAQSGAGGRFEITTSADSGSIRAASPPWATVRAGVFRPGSSVDPLVIIAPAIDLSGTVVDPEGRPVRGARVDVSLPAGFETRFSQILEATSVLGWISPTDESGRFALARVPRIEGSSLRAVVDGYQPTSVPCPILSDHGITITLERPKVELNGALRGQVVDANGVAVPEARVALGLTSTLCDAQGLFAIDLARSVTADKITAVKAGHLPAFMDRPAEPSGKESGWPDFVVLHLGGEPLSIRGVVVDAQHKPKEGVHIWLADPTPFGIIGRVPVQLEGLVAGEKVPPQIVQSADHMPAQDGDRFMDWTMSAPPSSVFWRWMAAERDGSFEFDGLADRSYRLRILDEHTLEIFTSDPIKAGARNVEIVMPASKIHPRLAGRVVSTSKAPVAGVRVRLQRDTYGVRTRVFGGTALYQASQPREAVVTDVDGRFEFENVPAEGLSLNLDGDKIVPADRALSAADAPQALEVVVELRCYIDVRLKPPLARADAIGVIDADGQNLDVMVLSQGNVNAYTDVPLVAGRSGVVSVSPRARTLVLLKDGEPVEQRALELVPGSVVVIEP